MCIDSGYDFRDFVVSLSHHLLDEHMLAGAECIEHHWDVKVIGCHDEDSLDVLAIQHATIVVGNRVRIPSNRFDAFLQVWRINVAEYGATACRDCGQMLQVIASLTP